MQRRSIMTESDLLEKSEIFYKIILSEIRVSVRGLSDPGSYYISFYYLIAISD